ncbi:hypothetical protein EROM_110910 [Encephalitozoon romaleae SJ-2008]|uniref:Uncharacterized protein n=1 Tax=Encephalitozoon romaleae (strain SJ-2008) TaxID=1178016 RepID=I6ZL72_ENCRO|nr:hypothetical protein EROM_110910 [Encephalitozoon romaleae SJ-2008]AFN84073.1 hypothetical protein EROM_110910 [Encephalitozoon romaleae SJ-2008]
MKDLLQRFSYEYVRFQYTPCQDSVSKIYTLLQYAPDSLVVHRELEIIPSFELLRKCRDRVKVVVGEDPFQMVLRHLDGFNTFIFLEYEFNSFEHEFLRQASIVNKKSIFLFSEVQKDCMSGKESYRLVKLDLCLPWFAYKPL